MSTEKVEGAVKTCTACGEEIECKASTYQGKKKLSWYDKGTDLKHFMYDFKTNKTWCKNTPQEPAQKKIDSAIKEQTTMMEEANISKGEPTPPPGYHSDGKGHWLKNEKQTEPELKTGFDLDSEYREFGDKLKQNYRNMFALANELLLQLDPNIDLKLDSTDQRRARIIKALQKERELAILGVKKF